MKYLLVFLLSVWISGCSEDKQVNQPQGIMDKKDFLVSAEQMPMPVGGIEAIQANVVYPKEAKEKNIEGKVYVQAFIDTDGSVKIAEVMKGIDPLLDKAALDAVKNVKFTPGYNKGAAVKTQIVIPIVFKLNGDKKRETVLSKDSDYYLQAEEMPEIIGGINAIMGKIVYPESEKKAGKQGKVYVKLFINEKGEIVKKEVEKGVSTELDRAALNAFNDVKFTPGKVEGKPVKVVVVVPVQFKLQ